MDSFATEVDSVKRQLAEVKSLLNAEQSPVPTTIEPTGKSPEFTTVGKVPAAAIKPSIPEVYSAGLLQLKLPPPSSEAIAEALSIRAA